MKKLFTKKEYEKSTSRAKLPLECACCQNTFYRTKNDIMRIIKKQNEKQNCIACRFCSHSCAKKHHLPPLVKINCAHCDKELMKQQSVIKKSKTGNVFCNRSCSGTYNNLHKKTGTRRSKFEAWAEDELTKLYPQLDILYNDKTAINSELDIYIPSLKLAFELNGIYHYEPIHGQKKFAQIQNNDKNKFQLCIKNDISLCLIDISTLKYFKPKNAQKYLDIVINIIDNQL